MADLIDRQALLEVIQYRLPDEHIGAQIIRKCVEITRETIKRAPAVDAEPVKHGWWEPRKDALGFVCCSVCHDCNIYGDWADGKKWNYCPNCGAKMQGGADE